MLKKRQTTFFKVYNYFLIFNLILGFVRSIQFKRFFFNLSTVLSYVHQVHLYLFIILLKSSPI